MLLSTMVIVTLVMGDGKAPEMNVSPSLTVSYEKCLNWQAERRAEPPQSVDPITGKRLIAVYYECVPVDPEVAIRDLQEAMQTYK